MEAVQQRTATMNARVLPLCVWFYVRCVIVGEPGQIGRSPSLPDGQQPPKSCFANNNVAPFGIM